MSEIEQVISRLDRIETKVDSLSTEMSELRGERKVWHNTVMIISGFIGTVVGVLFNKVVSK